jgi:hypothetical protein
MQGFGLNDLPRSKLSRYQIMNFFIFDAGIGVLNSFILKAQCIWIHSLIVLMSNCFNLLYSVFLSIFNNFAACVLLYFVDSSAFMIISFSAIAVASFSSIEGEALTCTI